MAEITAALVKELRETSGAGMMDCKRALTETAGNWAPVSGQPVSVDGHLQLVIPATLSNVFYRLQSP